MSDDERRPLFRVVRGTPDDGEVAAVAAVLATVLAEHTDAEHPPDPTAVASRWTDRAAHLRGRLAVGPVAWRTSTWPG